MGKGGDYFKLCTDEYDFFYRFGMERLGVIQLAIK